jgi:hypothetical protein
MRGAVVDEAGQVEPKLGMVVDALCEPLGHHARAHDQRTLAQLRCAVNGHACACAGEPGDGSARQCADEGAGRGTREAHRDEQRVHRPRHGEAGQHELRCLADAARPGAQVLPGVESAQERGDGPRDRDDGGEQKDLPTGPASDGAHERAAGHAREHVGDEEEAAEVMKALTGGIGAASQELKLQSLCVNRHQTCFRRINVSCWHPYLHLVCPYGT